MFTGTPLLSFCTQSQPEFLASLPADEAMCLPPTGGGQRGGVHVQVWRLGWGGEGPLGGLRGDVLKSEEPHAERVWAHETRLRKTLEEKLWDQAGTAGSDIWG